MLVIADEKVFRVALQYIDIHTYKNKHQCIADAFWNNDVN